MMRSFEYTPEYDVRPNKICLWRMAHAFSDYMEQNVPMAYNKKKKKLEGLFSKQMFYLPDKNIDNSYLMYTIRNKIIKYYRIIYIIC